MADAQRTRASAAAARAAGRTETLGGEWELARGIVWRLAAAITATRWWPGRLALDTRLPHAAQLEHKRLRRWRAQTSA
jgi:hypothetical protein